MILDRFDLIEAEQSRAATCFKSTRRMLVASANQSGVYWLGHDDVMPQPIRVAFASWVMMTYCLSNASSTAAMLAFG